MHRHAVVALAILTALVPLPPASADDEAASRTFTLHHVAARDAATVVRTIAGIRELAAPDDQTIEIRGPRASLELAAELVSALDSIEVDASQSFTTGDETVVRLIPLGDMSPADAMVVMRELEIQRSVAAVGPGVVVVRDTPEQVAAAIAALDES